MLAARAIRIAATGAIVAAASCADRVIDPPLAPTSISFPAAPSAPDATSADNLGAAAPLGGSTAVLVAAGDIALCESLDRATATARLVEREVLNGAIAVTLGDNSNNEGRPDEYRNCFEPTWGRVPLRPSPGNHDDYDERLGNGGARYFEFFGALAGPPGLGYYSFRAGDWLVLSLNSEIMNRGLAERAQLAWVRSELLHSPATRCVAAYFHRPMVSSGNFAAQRIRRLWEVLYAGGVDVVINGHEHFYERFAPQKPTGEADPRFGIRQFIAGTGGAHFHRAGARAANSEIVVQEALGILRLTLSPRSYGWEFIDTSGGIRDAGATDCHGRPPAM